MLVVGWLVVLVVELPAEQMVLLWGDVISLVALVKPVAWGSPQTGDFQLGHLIYEGKG